MVKTRKYAKLYLRCLGAHTHTHTHTHTHAHTLTHTCVYAQTVMTRCVSVLHSLPPTCVRTQTFMKSCYWTYGVQWSCGEHRMFLLSCTRATTNSIFLVNYFSVCVYLVNQRLHFDVVLPTSSRVLTVSIFSSCVTALFLLGLFWGLPRSHRLSSHSRFNAFVIQTKLNTTFFLHEPIVFYKQPSSRTLWLPWNPCNPCNL